MSKKEKTPPDYIIERIKTFSKETKDKLYYLLLSTCGNYFIYNEDNYHHAFKSDTEIAKYKNGKKLANRKKKGKKINAKKAVSKSTKDPGDKVSKQGSRRKNVRRAVSKSSKTHSKRRKTRKTRSI